MKPEFQHDLRSSDEAMPSGPAGSHRAEFLLIATALLVGTALRFYHLAIPELWLDEYGTQWAAFTPDWRSLIERVLRVQGQSPLYYGFVRLSLEVFGNSHFALRLPSAIFGVLALAVAHPLARRLIGKGWPAAVAVVVFALDETMIQQSQDARPYVLATLLAMLSFLFYIELRRRDSYRLRLAWILCTAACFYAHFIFGFILVIQLSDLLLRKGYRALRNTKWTLSSLALGLLMLPATGQVVTLFSRRSELNWIRDKPWGYSFEVFLGFLHPSVLAAVVVTLLFVGVGPLGSACQGLRTDRRLIALWWLLPIVAFGLVPPLFDVRLLTPRYVSLSVPASLMVITWLLAVAPRGWRRWTVLATFALASFGLELIPFVHAEGSFSSKPESGWQSSASVVEEMAGADDLILFASGFVEANLIVTGEVDETLWTFVTSPLMAHLAPQRATQVLCLPLQIDDSARDYIHEVLREAASHQRVWIVGERGVVESISKSFHSPESGFRQVQRQVHGRTAVVEFSQMGIREDTPTPEPPGE